jgi:hypothetical protein
MGKAETPINTKFFNFSPFFWHKKPLIFDKIGKKNILF